MIFTLYCINEKNFNANFFLFFGQLFFWFFFETKKDIERLGCGFMHRFLRTKRRACNRLSLASRVTASFLARFDSKIRAWPQAWKSSGLELKIRKLKICGQIDQGTLLSPKKHESVNIKLVICFSKIFSKKTQSTKWFCEISLVHV